MRAATRLQERNRRVGRRAPEAGGLETTSAGLCVYLAARYSRLQELRSCREELAPAGIQVSSRWLDGEHEIRDGGSDGDARAATLALEDLRDVAAADVLVAFGDAPRMPTRGGAHVEVGYALGLGRPVVWVGPPEHVFCWHPWVRRVESWVDALRWLCAEQARLENQVTAC